VQDLYVAPEARGTGLGRRLLGAAALEGIREGARYMKLAVHDGNDAEKFYRRLGYVPSSDETVFALKGEAFQSLAAAL
jgi:GNAT superfamily N-acetyltransferase